jgi:GNAT superfamily N-acetyltransferase
MNSRDAIVIRLATAGDAEAICRVAIRTLRQTNARDYSADDIARLVAGFSPQRIAAFIARRPFYVAIVQGSIVGTANLDGAAARAVFVDPDHQGKRIGSGLMAAVEDNARARAVATLHVQSSITAEGFSRTLGYVAVGEKLHGTERTIMMEKHLGPLGDADHSRKPADWRHGEAARLVVPFDSQSHQKADAANAIVRAVTAWALAHEDIRAMALVGSWARGNPHRDSDIDLLLLSNRADEYRRRRKWLTEVDFEGVGYRVLSTKNASYGAVWSRHVTLVPTSKVELTFARCSWARIDPVNIGTRSIVKDAFRVIIDKDRILATLVEAVMSG